MHLNSCEGDFAATDIARRASISGWLAIQEFHAPPAGYVGPGADRDPAVIAHQAIPEALRLAGIRTGDNVEGIWLHTASIAEPAAQLRDFGGSGACLSSDCIRSSTRLLAVSTGTGREGFFRPHRVQHADAIGQVQIEN